MTRIKATFYFPLQPHPNVDKQQFNKSRIIALKNPNKPFPQNQEAGILRWRLQTTDESYLPLSSNYSCTRGSQSRDTSLCMTPSLCGRGPGGVMHSEVSWPWELLFAGHGYLFIIYGRHVSMGGLRN